MSLRHAIPALVSSIDAREYEAGVDERLSDLAWLGPRATAHDAVWITGRGVDD